MNWDKILTNVKDYHLPMIGSIFGVGAVLQWFHHMDPTFVAFTSVVVGGVASHAFSPARKDDDQQ
jgi:hypothetical protein